MIRTNMPTTAVDHAILPYDKGVVVSAAGVNITMPPYNDSMQGEGYIVTNVSSGSINLLVPVNAQGIQGHIKKPNDGTLVISYALPAVESYTLFIATDELAWIIT